MQLEKISHCSRFYFKRMVKAVGEPEAVGIMNDFNEGTSLREIVEKRPEAVKQLLQFFVTSPKSRQYAEVAIKVASGEDLTKVISDV